MVYALAVAAALANALTSIFQRIGVEDAPEDTTLRLSLMAHAIRRGIWLLGFALMVVSFVMQAIALHLGSLTSVQPILTTELPFLVLILVVWFHVKVGPSRVGARRGRGSRSRRVPVLRGPRAREVASPVARPGPRSAAPVRSPWWSASS